MLHIFGSKGLQQSAGTLEVF